MPVTTKDLLDNPTIPGYVRRLADPCERSQYADLRWDTAEERWVFMNNADAAGEQPADSIRMHFTNTQNVGLIWYVDPVEGSDTYGTGSRHLPFQSVAMARSFIKMNYRREVHGEIRLHGKVIALVNANLDKHKLLNAINLMKLAGTSDSTGDLVKSTDPLYWAGVIVREATKEMPVGHKAVVLFDFMARLGYRFVEELNATNHTPVVKLPAAEPECTGKV